MRGNTLSGFILIHYQLHGSLGEHLPREQTLDHCLTPLGKRSEVQVSFDPARPIVISVPVVLYAPSQVGQPRLGIDGSKERAFFFGTDEVRNVGQASRRGHAGSVARRRSSASQGIGHEHEKGKSRSQVLEAIYGVDLPREVVVAMAPSHTSGRALRSIGGTTHGS